MKRKILLVCSILAFIIVAGICMYQDAKRGFHVTVTDEESIEKIKAKSKLTEMAFLLCYEGEELPYDSATHTFYLPLDMDRENWEEGVLTGYFVENSLKDFKDEKYKAHNTEAANLYFSQDYKKEAKKSAIAKGQAFRFLALSKEGYGEYQIVFSGLPIVTFSGTEYKADDGTQLFQFKVYDTDHSGDWVTDCYTQSRLRGNTSLTYEKKSLRLYLKDQKKDGTFRKTNKNLLGLRDDDDWILNALYADNARIRDKLCVDLWKEVGAKTQPYEALYGTDAAMVEVFINDGYQGLYDLMVPIDAKQLGLDKVSDQLSKGQDVIERIYKKKYSREWMSSDFKGELPDANSIDYRGGFYLKGDTILQNEEEWKPLYSLAKSLEAEDSVFAKEITVCNDQQNLICNWLFYQAIAGFDNENKNYYYVVRNREGRDYGYFIPWDLNISFGMVYEDNSYYATELMEVVTKPVTWQPAQRMIELDVQGSKELTHNMWKQWRSSTFSDESLTNRIKDLEHKVKDSGAFKRESQRYPNGNQKEDFSYLYDFAMKRLAYVDQYVGELTR